MASIAASRRLRRVQRGAAPATARDGATEARIRELAAGEDGAAASNRSTSKRRCRRVTAGSRGVIRRTWGSSASPSMSLVTSVVIRWRVRPEWCGKASASAQRCSKECQPPGVKRGPGSLETAKLGIVAAIACQSPRPDQAGPARAAEPLMRPGDEDVATAMARLDRGQRVDAVDTTTVARHASCSTGTSRRCRVHPGQRDDLVRGVIAPRSASRCRRRVACAGSSRGGPSHRRARDSRSASCSRVVGLGRQDLVAGTDQPASRRARDPSWSSREGELAARRRRGTSPRPPRRPRASSSVLCSCRYAAAPAPALRRWRSIAPRPASGASRQEGIEIPEAGRE